jgi:hypothetical protein
MNEMQKKNQQKNSTISCIDIKSKKRTHISQLRKLEKKNIHELRDKSNELFSLAFFIYYF